MPADTPCSKPSQFADLAIFMELKKLKAYMRPHMNDHELADLLIDTCIENGWNNGPKIIDIMVHLKFKLGHIGLRLRYGTGANPARHRWRKDDDGVYHCWTERTASSQIVVPRQRPTPSALPPPRVSAKDIRIDDEPPF